MSLYKSKMYFAAKTAVYQVQCHRLARSCKWFTGYHGAPKVRFKACKGRLSLTVEI